MFVGNEMIRGWLDESDDLSQTKHFVVFFLSDFGLSSVNITSFNSISARLKTQFLKDVGVRNIGFHAQHLNNAHVPTTLSIEAELT